MKTNIKTDLDDTDTAIIIDKDGNLKTLILPNESDEAIVPDNIVKIIDFLVMGKGLE
jgi:hypothetical protein